MAKKNKKQSEAMVQDEGQDGGRVRRYQFSLQLFNEMFMTGNTIKVRVKVGWPEDAVVVGVHPDEKTYSFSMVVHSRSFELVPNGEEMPNGEIIFARLPEEVDIPVKTT